MLQPLVENALKYGFRDSQTKLRIEMLGYRREDCVYITVSDDGAGMSSSKLHIIRETLKGREQTNSIGLPECKQTSETGIWRSIWIVS